VRSLVGVDSHRLGTGEFAHRGSISTAGSNSVRGTDSSRL
jgi:hypothetical protein